MKIKKNHIFLYSIVVVILIILFQSELITLFYPDREVILKEVKMDIRHFESEKFIKQIKDKLDPIENKMQLLNLDIRFNSKGEIIDFSTSFISSKEILFEKRSFLTIISLINNQIVLRSSIMENDSDIYVSSDQLGLELKDSFYGLNKIPWNDLFSKYTIEKPDYYSIYNVINSDKSQIESESSNNIQIQSFIVSPKGVEKLREPKLPGTYSIKYSVTPFYSKDDNYEGSYEGKNHMNWFVDHELLK